jgi:hypothetical protein
MTETTDITGTTPAAVPPNPVADARARRDAMMRDKDLAAKYRRGDMATVKEFRDLNRAIVEQDLGARIDDVLAGTAPKGEFVTTRHGELTPSNYASAHDQFAPALGNQAFKDVVVGTAVTQAQHDAAVNAKKIVMSDREWVRAYRQNSEAHRQQMTRINAVLIAPIAEAQ